MSSAQSRSSGRSARNRRVVSQNRAHSAGVNTGTPATNPSVR